MRLASSVGAALLALIAGCASPTGAPSGEIHGSERVVQVSAERFQFRPSTIRVRTGETVRVVLRSADTTHGFAIDAVGVDVLVPPTGRGTAEATFVAPAPGTYPFRCSHICGAGHSQMRGRLVVE